jgi:UDP-N-acetylmuramyl pentapeptide synthase
MIIAKYLEHQEFKSFYHNVEKSAAIQRFLKQVMVGDLVYLKGSRSMQLEDFLTAYKESN